MSASKSKWKIFLSALAVLAIAVFAAGCGSDDSNEGGGETTAAEETTSAGGGESKGTVGLAQALNNSAHSVAMTDLVKQHLEEAGYETVFASADGDTSQQVSDIQSMLARNVVGLVVWPVDANAVVPAIEEATEAGVPVVTPNFGANSSEIYMNVDPDQEILGRDQCENAGEALNGEGEIFYVAGNLNDLLGAGRWRGFETCMKENYPNIKITMQEAEWDGAKGANLVQTAFSSKDYDGLVMASDTVFLPGIMAVLKQMNKLKPIGDPDHIYMIGVDGGPAAAQAIQDDLMDATIVQPLEENSRLAVQYLIDAIEGKPRPEAGPTDHNSEIVERDGAWFDLVPGFVATKDNVDDPAVWGNRYKDAE